MAPRSRSALLAILALVLALSAGTRLIHHDRTPLPEGSGWFAYDPDSSYQMRRLERALEEGLPVARTDPFLAHPEGSPIPWPPGYTYVLWASLGPFVASDDPAQQRANIERGVASLPVLFGIATSLAAALAGWVLAGRVGALVAGTHHALSLASILYSRHGNGDHHAFVSMLDAAVLLLLGLALARGVLEDPRRAWRWGALIGALAAWNLVTWVAALLYVIQVEVVLAVLLFVHARRPLPGLAAFGLAFHAAALVVATGFCATSPWTAEHPWIVVNLSWFHPTFLALGAAVFLPLLFLGGRDRVRRTYPWAVGLALAAGFGLLHVLGTPLAAGVAEGFAWVSSLETFMSDITESRPLVGPGANPDDHFGFLGYASPLVPLVWLFALVRLVRRGELELLPWVVSVPLLAIQAAAQMRFADGLAMPMAVLLGWGAAQVRLPRVPAPATAALAFLATCAVQWHGLVGTARLATTAPLEHRIALRELLDWLRTHTPEDSAVLAHWDRGHPIEWAAGRPAVATNFGSYVGVASFQAPSRFFLAEDPALAEAVLEERRARYVLVSSRLPWLLRFLERALDPEAPAVYATRTDGALEIQRRWFSTVGAALVLDETSRGPRVEPVDFLRLVHVSPTTVTDSPLRGLTAATPYGWIWEHVPGATLEARLAPGATLTARVELEYPGREAPWVWEARSVAGADGVARLRVPYTTVGPNGDGRALGPLEWSGGGSGGVVDVPVGAVERGGVVSLP